MCHHLYFVHHGFGAQIHSFVLMSNHFHLLMSTPMANVSETMGYFMRETSRAITRSSGRINQTYGGRYFRCLIGSHHHFLNAYKYFYRNPVEAQVVKRAEDYPYSTLHGLLGRSKLLVPVREDSFLFDDLNGTLAWINRDVDRGDWECVRKALHRRSFRMSKKHHHLESNLL